MPAMSGQTCHCSGPDSFYEQLNDQQSGGVLRVEVQGAACLGKCETRGGAALMLLYEASTGGRTVAKPTSEEGPENECERGWWELAPHLQQQTRGLA